jgi:hypothetical protein
MDLQRIRLAVKEINTITICYGRCKGMKKEGMIWKVTTCLLFIALMVSLYVNQVQAGQPHMQSALAALQTAKAELQSAEHDKGGHRAKAVGFVNSAIAEVQAGIAVGAGK